MSATKKNIAKDLLLNVVIIMVAVVLVKSVSYANEETDKDNKNVFKPKNENFRIRIIILNKIIGSSRMM